MLRRYLFWGLTLVLVVALTNLIIRGCRLEKEQARQHVETVEEAKPTFTRVQKPQDLKIVQSKMELEKKTDTGKPLNTARHEIEIHNGGNVPYKEIQIRFVYLSRTGNKLETRTHSIDQSILPGTTLKLASFRVDGIPSSVTNLQATIICADIAPSIPPKQ